MNKTFFNKKSHLKVCTIQILLVILHRNQKQQLNDMKKVRLYFSTYVEIPVSDNMSDGDALDFARQNVTDYLDENVVMDNLSYEDIDNEIYTD